MLELLLDQERATEVEQLLHDVSPEFLYLSEFSLHSLGVILLRRKSSDAFLQMVKSLLLDGGLQLVRLSPEDMQVVTQEAETYALDFDDAYQLTVARKYDLTLVSFDRDFDKTDHRRQEPADILGKPAATTT